MSSYADIMKTSVEEKVADTTEETTEVVDGLQEEVETEETTVESNEETQDDSNESTKEPSKKTGAEKRIAYLVKKGHETEENFKKQLEEMKSTFERQMNELKQSKVEPEEDPEIDDVDDLLKYSDSKYVKREDLDKYFEDKLKDAQGNMQKQTATAQQAKIEAEFAGLLEKKYKSEGKSIETLEDYERAELLEDAQKYMRLFKTDTQYWLDYANKHGIESIEAIIDGNYSKKVKKTTIDELKKAANKVKTESSSSAGGAEVVEKKNMSYIDILKDSMNKRKQQTKG